MPDQPDYPKELTSLRSAFTDPLKIELDLWVYESFNWTYKPSDWTRNPESDLKMLSFAKDGVGGQVLMWRRDPNAPLLECPVAFLGRDGEVAVITRSFPDFGELLAQGVSAYQVATESLPATSNPSAPIAEWLKGAFGIAPTRKPAELAAAARELLPEFKSFIAAERKR